MSNGTAGAGGAAGAGGYTDFTPQKQVDRIHLLAMLAPMSPICWVEVEHLLTKVTKPIRGHLLQGNLNYKTQRFKV
jgi:hypothetical protein